MWLHYTGADVVCDAEPDVLQTACKLQLDACSYHSQDPRISQGS